MQRKQTSTLATLQQHFHSLIQRIARLPLDVDVNEEKGGSLTSVSSDEAKFVLSTTVEAIRQEKLGLLTTGPVAPLQSVFYDINNSIPLITDSITTFEGKNQKFDIENYAPPAAPEVQAVAACLIPTDKNMIREALVKLYKIDMIHRKANLQGSKFSYDLTSLIIMLEYQLSVSNALETLHFDKAKSIEENLQFLDADITKLEIQKDALEKEEKDTTPIQDQIANRKIQKYIYITNICRENKCTKNNIKEIFPFVYSNDKKDDSMNDKKADSLKELFKEALKVQEIIDSFEENSLEDLLKWDWSSSDISKDPMKADHSSEKNQFYQRKHNGVKKSLAHFLKPLTEKKAEETLDASLMKNWIRNLKLFYFMCKGYCKKIKTAKSVEEALYALSQFGAYLKENFPTANKEKMEAEITIMQLFGDDDKLSESTETLVACIDKLFEDGSLVGIDVPANHLDAINCGLHLFKLFTTGQDHHHEEQEEHSSTAEALDTFTKSASYSAAKTENHGGFMNKSPSISQVKRKDAGQDKKHQSELERSSSISVSTIGAVKKPPLQINPSVLQENTLRAAAFIRKEASPIRNMRHWYGRRKSGTKALICIGLGLLVVAAAAVAATGIGAAVMAGLAAVASIGGGASAAVSTALGTASLVASSAASVVAGSGSALALAGNAGIVVLAAVAVGQSVKMAAEVVNEGLDPTTPDLSVLEEHQKKQQNKKVSVDLDPAEVVAPPVPKKKEAGSSHSASLENKAAVSVPNSQNRISPSEDKSAEVSSPVSPESSSPSSSPVPEDSSNSSSSQRAYFVERLRSVSHRNPACDAKESPSIGRSKSLGNFQDQPGNPTFKR
jgi:hypothetical protein